MRLNGRELLKAAFRGGARILVLPCVVSFEIRARLLGRDRALFGSTQALSLVPGLAGQYIRRAFLQHAISCHHTVVVEFGTTLSRAGARLDENVYIGPGCHLALVHIQRNALIAAGVHIPSGASSHGFDDVSKPIREQPTYERLIRIGEGAWIGASAVVMAAVGEETIVGAGAVVTRALPAWVVAAGVPARVLHPRNNRARQARAV